jgi:AbrB family looped-hinge helix DNA binding protein
MPQLTIKVDNQGRVMLPAEWRRKHGVRASSELIVRESQDGEMVIATRGQGIERARAILQKYIPKGVLLVDELIADRREEARREQGE